MMNYKVLALCVIVFLALCHTIIAAPYYECKDSAAEPDSPAVRCDFICPDLTTDPICRDDDKTITTEPDCTGLTKPTECAAPEWKCNVKDAAESTAEQCKNDVRANWDEKVDDSDDTKMTFSREVHCIAVNYLNNEVELKTCVAKDEPIKSIEATRAYKSTQCFSFEAVAPEPTWVPCPDAATFAESDENQSKFCSGLDAGLKQQCEFSITATTPAPVEDEDDEVVFTFPDFAPTCTEIEVIKVTCPVYLLKCVDKYAIKQDDGTTPETFKVANETEEDDGDDEPTEMDAKTCATAKPTCPACTPEYLEQTSFDVTTAEAGISVHCYKDAEQKYKLKSELPTKQYSICLRSGALKTDPETVEPATKCADLKTCAYYKCQEKVPDDVTPAPTPAWSFQSCYNDDAQITCIREGNGFPACTGKGNKTSKCYLFGEEQTDAKVCANYEGYELPKLDNVDCKPDNCPAFTWSTDIFVKDGEDSDYGEELTSDDVYLVTPTTTITASLNNVDLTKKWSIKVYQRTIEVDDETKKEKVNYLHLERFDQSDIKDAKTTLTIDFVEDELDSYFVLRAEYDEYTMITEEESGRCEILDIKNVYPANPANCDKSVDEKDDKDDETDDKKGKQSPGREKLAIMVDDCHVKFGQDCQNGSICQGVPTKVEGKTEEVIEYSCSACPQGWSGDACHVCHLTGFCQNDSTPYHGDDKVPVTFRLSAVDNVDDGTDDNNEQADDDESYNGQCRCKCDKANVGPFCQCDAFYARVTFKGKFDGKLAVNAWLEQFIFEISSATTLSQKAFSLVSYQLDKNDKNSNHVVLSIAACNVPNAKMLMQQLAQVGANDTDYDQNRVEFGWNAYRSGDQDKITAAKNVGGVYAVSQPYSPKCVKDCVADPTAASYEVPKADKVGGGVNAGWVILGIVIALVVIIVIFALCMRFLKNNKKKNFGSGDGLDMTDLS